MPMGEDMLGEIPTSPRSLYIRGSANRGAEASFLSPASSLRGSHEEGDSGDCPWSNIVGQGSPEGCNHLYGSEETEIKAASAGLVIVPSPQPIAQPAGQQLPLFSGTCWPTE